MYESITLSRHMEVLSRALGRACEKFSCGILAARLASRASAGGRRRRTVSRVDAFIFDLGLNQRLDLPVVNP